MEFLIVFALFSALLGGPVVLLLVLYAVVVIPYAISFHLSAGVLEIKERKIYRSAVLAALALSVPSVMIGAYEAVGGEWIFVGMGGSLVMMILFIKGIYRTTYLRSAVCYLLSYLFLFMGLTLLFLLGIGLGLKYGKEPPPDRVEPAPPVYETSQILPY